jgi:ribosomal protein S19
MEKKEKLKKFKKELVKKYLLFSLFKGLDLKKKIFFDKSSSVQSLISGVVLYVYNGNVFRKINVTQFLVCLKIGCFLFTRKPFKYLLKKKKR